MPEPKVIKRFKCPNCGESETVTGIAVQEQINKGKIKPNTSYALRKELKPLIPIEQAMLTVPIIAVNWDICANCGTLYPTSVETLDAPLTLEQKQPGTGPRKGFGLPFFGKG